MNERNATNVIIGRVRFSYVHVFKAEAVATGSDAKFSLSLIIPKSDTALLNKIKGAINAAAQAGIGKLGGKIPANLKTPLRDGDVEKPDDEAYAGCYFINASSKTRPGVGKKVNGKYVEITDESEVYSGCYGYASVNFFVFNTSGNKGVAAGLNNVLKTQDGEYLGGRVSGAAEFGGSEFEDMQDDLPSDIF